LRCGKPVKGTVPASYTWGLVEGDSEELVAVCGIHAAGYRRRTENDAKYRREADEAAARWARDREATRAATETLERIKPMLEQLGIHLGTVKVDKGNLSLPAETVESLVRKVHEGWVR
jgi:hypothetical protein